MSKKKDKEPLDLLKSNSVQREMLTISHDYFRSRIWDYWHEGSITKYKPAGWVRTSNGWTGDIRIVITAKRIYITFITKDNMIVCYRFTIDGLAKKETYFHEQMLIMKMLNDDAYLFFADTNDLEMLSTEIEEGLLRDHAHKVHDEEGFELLRKRSDNTRICSDYPDIVVSLPSDLSKEDLAYINGNFITTMISLKFPSVNIRHIIYNSNNPTHFYRTGINRKLVEEILHDVRMRDADSKLQTEDMCLAFEFLDHFTKRVPRGNTKYSREPFEIDDDFDF